MQSTARLAELNKLAEDPNLWNDPQKAQKLMRERTALEDALDGIGKVERELDDNVEHDRARRGRGRRRRRRRGRGRAEGAEEGSRAPRARSAAVRRGRPQSTPISKSMPAPAAPRARTGPRCCCACTRAGPSSTASRSSISKRPRAKRPASSRRRIQIKGHNAYGWLKTETGVHRLVRISPFDSNARRHTSFASASGSIRWSTTRIEIDINESDVPHRHHALAAAPAASTSTRPNSAVRITHIPTGIAVACQAGALAAQEPRAGLGHAARAALRDRAEEARGSRPPPTRPPRPISAGATRSAPTCCSPTRW